MAKKKKNSKNVNINININKRQKKKFVRFILFLIIIIILAIIGYFAKDYILPSNNNSNSNSNSNLEEESAIKNEGITYDNFQIHFLELGVYETGDSTYIKAGNTDILIDAGASTSSVPTIIEYVNNYCSDGKLEYVITTHAHTDHYAGMFGKKQASKNFKGESTERNGIMYYYDIGTIIDFAKTAKTAEQLANATSEINTYYAAVDYATSKGAKHYTAEECFNEQNGAKKSYILDETYNISMDILYNKYYFEASSDENNHSVCTMFNYNDHHFLLTGDLEKEGEEELSKYYDKSTPEKTLPHVELFKAGHHGSKTSSNDCLLDLITPEICCVCCCAGSSEYTNINDNTFPTQEFIDRISKHTDQVYVTSLLDTKESREKGEQVFKSFNGNIIISCDGTQIGIAASNNLIKLKDSAWFNEQIAVIVDDKNRNTICSGTKKKDYYLSTDENVIMVPRRIWPTN